MENIKDALDQMTGAVMIVYPMGLPPHDPIRLEFENSEDLSGTQVRFALPFWLCNNLMTMTMTMFYLHHNKQY